MNERPAEDDRYGFLSSDGYPEEGPNPLIKPPPSAEKDGLCHEFIETGRCEHSDVEHDALADGLPAEKAAHRLARIRRSANAAMVGVGPRFQPDREDVFRVSDVLWLLDQVDARPSDSWKWLACCEQQSIDGHLPDCTRPIPPAKGDAS